MTTPAVIGLDLSSTATGIATDTGTLTLKPKGTLHPRARAMADSIVALAFTHPRPLVIMEAIGTRHVATAIAISTVHALTRYHLHTIGIEPVEIPPAVLKKWATGKGNCDKTAMILAATRAGWDAPADATDDQADAWWLRSIGLAAQDQWEVSRNAARVAIITDLLRNNTQVAAS